MVNSAIQTLEAAAQMLMAPPNMVTSEQRHQAEVVFLEFRNTKNPYEMCRELLEKSSSDYVLFEAAGLLKSGLVREWEQLSQSDIASLREYLLNYLMRKDSPPFLREKLLQTIAIIVKRGSIDDNGRERKALLTELEKIILSSPMYQQKLASSLILAIMQEYAITVKSADVGLMWEVHFRLKKSFEASDLKRIFRFSVSVLEQIVRSGHRPEGERAALTKQLLSIVESVLCWSHVSPLLSKRLIGAFEAIHESDSAPALRLNLSWVDTIMQPELLQLFFEIHVYVRPDPDLINSSLTCLVQLASLSGFPDDLKKQYLDNYVNSFMNAMAYIEPYDKEFLGIADIYRRLNQFFRSPMIATLPPSFLQTLTTLTCHCIRGSVVEESIDDDTVWREALNKFLHTWSSLVTEVDGYPEQTLLGPCVQVFNTYLQCRLAPPDGARAREAGAGAGAGAGDERALHAADLLTVGALARKAPAHAARLLHQLLRDRSKRLENQLHQMHMGKLQVSDGSELSSLFEDLHWILMITGHFLAVDCTEGETVLIPGELVRHSLAENADLDASLSYLTNTNTDPENVDSIMKLLGEVFVVSAWEGSALAAGLGGALSPELSASVSWLLKIWANSYLMIDEREYAEMSAVLSSAFGRCSAGVPWAVARLLARVGASLRHLHAQPPAAAHALQLLTTLVQRRRIIGVISRSEEFLQLVAWEREGCDLPGPQRRELYRAFAIVARDAEEPARALLLESAAQLARRLEALLALASGARDAEPARAALADLLDCGAGLADGLLEAASGPGPLLASLAAALRLVPALLARLHEYPGVVRPALRLLERGAARLRSLPPDNTDVVDDFLEVCHSSFEEFQRWNSGKLSGLPADAEDDACEDVECLMELTSGCARLAAERPGAGARAVSRGLRALLPLVTPALLARPRLQARLYHTIRGLERYDQLALLPAEQFSAVAALLRAGLGGAGEVAALSCGTLAALAERGARAHEAALAALAEPLLAQVARLALPAGAVPAAGAALYALVVRRPALLEALARALAAAAEARAAPRLQAALAALTAGLRFDGARAHRIRFQDNFDKFLTALHGFLVRK